MNHNYLGNPTAQDRRQLPCLSGLESSGRVGRDTQSDEDSPGSRVSCGALKDGEKEEQIHVAGGTVPSTPTFCFKSKSGS